MLAAPTSGMTPRMLVAVAGASGRVGRRLLAELGRRRIPAVALLRARSSASKLPRGMPYHLVHFETGWGLSEALRGATHVVNLTGSTDTARGERALREANVAPTSHLLSCSPPTLARFVHVSSIAVYGQHLRQIADERSPRRPDTPYARTKMQGERAALEAARRFPVVVLQPGIIYGPGFEAGFFPMLGLLRAGRLSLIGNGDNHLPLVHVDDVVSGIIRALVANVPSGSVFILCGADHPTQKQALEMAAREMHVPPPMRHISPALARLAAHAHLLSRRLQHRPASVTPDIINQLAADRFFDIERARRALGWRPAISFKAGLKQVLAEFRKTKTDS